MSNYQKDKNARELDTSLSSPLLWSCSLLSPTKLTVLSVLSGFKEMAQSLPSGASWHLSFFASIYAVLSAKNIRPWVYHSTGPFICTWFWHHQLPHLYFLVQVSVQGSDNNARQLHYPTADLRSLQLPSPSLPFRSQWSMISSRFWVASSPLTVSLSMSLPLHPYLLRVKELAA